jgi:HK97 gp10 family phage protein
MKTQKVKGIPLLLKQLDSFGEDGRRLAVAITNSTAQKITNKAKLRSPVDLGQLRQSIGNTEATLQINRSLIFASAPYAPYVNWGTGGSVSVEAIFEKYAEEFIGKGIRKINLPARPFLTGSYIEESSKYGQTLQKALQKLTEQYNNKK